MNDLRPLNIGAAQRNGLLSAKGRVQTLFVVFRTAEQEFVLAFPDGDAGSTLAELRRYILRSKLSLDETTDWQVLGNTEAPPPLDVSVVASMDWDGQRQLLLATADPQRGLDPQRSAQWYANDIDRGIPHLDQSGRADFTPQMLGLDRWRAFSLSKGCYPGQEIVARTHYLGQQKRALYRIRAERLAVGEAVMAEQRELARVFCAQGDHGLVVLPAEQPTLLTLADGRECQVQPFARD